MNRKSIDYGDGIMWCFDNYPEKYGTYWVDDQWVQIELPSQTLWI